MKTVCAWSDASSIHGVRYALNSSSGVVDRLVWTAITLSACAIALYMAVTIYVDWKNMVRGIICCIMLGLTLFLSSLW